MAVQYKVIMLASGDLWAGAEMQVFLLARALSRTHNIEVAAVLLNDGILADMLRSSGVQTQVIDESTNGFFTILIKLVRILRSFSPDIVHSHRKKENLLGALASLTSRHCHSISTVHGASEEPPSWRHPLQAATTFLAGKTATSIHSKILVVSDELGAQVRKLAGGNKTVVIRNCIDVERLQEFRPAEQDQFTVGVVGRLTPVKRIDIFLHAAERFLRSYERPSRFLIVGDGECRDELQILARKLGIDNSIEFTGFKEDVYAVISKLSVLLITSDHEGMPTVVMEALAIGIPIIAHAVGEIPAILNYGEYGELLASQNEDEFSKALLRHAHNPRELRSRAELGRERCLRDYSPDRTAEECMSAYMSCIVGAQN